MTPNLPATPPQGRKVRHVQENRRWIDDYRCVRLPGVAAGARRVVPWSCAQLHEVLRRAAPFQPAGYLLPLLSPPAPSRVPGQFVAARYCADGTSTEGCAAGSLRVAQRLLCLASSPYEARRDSAMLDASLVELLISRNGEWAGCCARVVPLGCLVATVPAAHMIAASIRSCSAWSALLRRSAHTFPWLLQTGRRSSVQAMVMSVCWQSWAPER